MFILCYKTFKKTFNTLSIYLTKKKKQYKQNIFQELLSMFFFLQKVNGNKEDRLKREIRICIMAIIYYNSVLTILSKVLLLNFEGET